MTLTLYHVRGCVDIGVYWCVDGVWMMWWWSVFVFGGTGQFQDASGVRLGTYRIWQAWSVPKLLQALLDRAYESHRVAPNEHGFADFATFETGKLHHKEANEPVHLGGFPWSYVQVQGTWTCYTCSIDTMLCTWETTICFWAAKTPCNHRGENAPALWTDLHHEGRNGLPADPVLWLD